MTHSGISDHPCITHTRRSSPCSDLQIHLSWHDGSSCPASSYTHSDPKPEKRIGDTNHGAANSAAKAHKSALTLAMPAPGAPGSGETVSKTKAEEEVVQDMTDIPKEPFLEDNVDSGIYTYNTYFHRAPEVCACAGGGAETRTSCWGQSLRTRRSRRLLCGRSHGWRRRQGQLRLGFVQMKGLEGDGAVQIGEVIMYAISL